MADARNAALAPAPGRDRARVTAAEHLTSSARSSRGGSSIILLIGARARCSKLSVKRGGGPLGSEAAEQVRAKHLCVVHTAVEKAALLLQVSLLPRVENIDKLEC